MKGYKLVEIEVECGPFTDGVHCHHEGDIFHFHVKIWVPVATKNIDEWLAEQEFIDHDENGYWFMKRKRLAKY